VALAVIGDLLAVPNPASEHVLAVHLDRIELTVDGLLPTLRTEVVALLTPSASAPACRVFVDLATASLVQRGMSLEPGARFH